MEVLGKVKFIGEVQSFGTGDFRKRQIVVTTEEQYPQHIAIDFIKDKCDLLNDYKLNESVKIGINLGGREWVNPQGETKYFNSITGWRIEKEASNVDKATAIIDKTFEPAGDLKEPDNDLPF